MIKWDEGKADEEMFAQFNDEVIAELPEEVHEKVSKLAAFLSDDTKALSDFGEVLILLTRDKKISFKKQKNSNRLQEGNT